jgi:hypothetical protein
MIRFDDRVATHGAASLRRAKRARRLPSVSSAIGLATAEGSAKDGITLPMRTSSGYGWQASPRLSPGEANTRSKSAPKIGPRGDSRVK